MLWEVIFYTDMKRVGRQSDVRRSGRIDRVQILVDTSHIKEENTPQKTAKNVY